LKGDAPFVDMVLAKRDARYKKQMWLGYVIASVISYHFLALDSQHIADAALYLAYRCTFLSG
jgi:hypothetical protein